MSLPPRPNAPLERFWPTASLRAYLFAMLLLATLPTALLMSLHRFEEIRSEQARTEQELTASAAALSASVERQLRSSIEGLQVLAQSELFQQGRIAALGRLLHGRPRGDWDSVFLLDRQGTVMLDTGQPRGKAGSEVLRSLHRQVLRGEAAVSGLWEQAPDHRWTAVAVPIVQNGQVRYVLGARMDDSVWHWLSINTRRPDAAKAQVFDAQGRLLGASTSSVPRGAALPADAAGDMARLAAGVHASSDVDGSAVYAAWHTNPVSGWRSRVAVPAAPIDAEHRRAIATALATTGGSLLLGLLLAGLVARRVTQPLRQLATGGGAGCPADVSVRELAALREALAAARAKDEFLLMLGHELRNPLSGISAAVAVLQTAPPDEAVAAEARAIIERQTDKLAHTVGELQDVARVLTGKVALARQPVDLAALVRQVQETLVLTGEAAGHPLELRLQPVWVDGDPVRIEQLVLNLVTHAIEHTPAARSIRIALGHSAGTAVLDVEDAGQEVEPEPAAQPLQSEREGPGAPGRAARSATGLALVRGLTQLHGGTVQVQRSGRGRRISIRLPAIAPPHKPADASLPAVRGQQVLLVGNEDDELAALRSTLEQDGHSVSAAVDGVGGLQCLLRLKPQVAIVDVGLRGLTAFEFARRARAAGYAGRMIAMSGCGAEGDARAAMVAGFDAHLAKPLDRQHLRATLGAE